MYECIGYEDVICSSAAFRKGSLKGMGNVLFDHEGHQSIINNPCEDFTKTAGNRYWSVVGWVILAPFLYRVVIYAFFHCCGNALDV